MQRCDFVFLFDVVDGNPNGDPDAGNLPRVDAETGHGIVTDVCLKRKIRNFVGLTHGENPPHEIYVKERAVLNQQHARAWAAVAPEIKDKERKDLQKAKKAADITNWMCRNFYDVRAFGAVMTTDVNCGQVRGPVQFTFARSIDPIVAMEHAVTRCAVTTEKESESQGGGNRTMGRKFTIPYALYRAHGYVNPYLAEKTGFGDDDLTLLWKSLEQMFEFDRSAARGLMSSRRLIVFRHSSPLGDAPAHRLFDRVTVARAGENGAPPRKFADYAVEIDRDGLPSGIEIDERF